MPITAFDSRVSLCHLPHQTWRTALYSNSEAVAHKMGWSSTHTTINLTMLYFSNHKAWMQEKQVLKQLCQGLITKPWSLIKGILTSFLFTMWVKVVSSVITADFFQKKKIRDYQTQHHNHHSMLYPSTAHIANLSEYFYQRYICHSNLA